MEAFAYPGYGSSVVYLLAMNNFSGTANATHMLDGRHHSGCTIPPTAAPVFSALLLC